MRFLRPTPFNLLVAGLLIFFLGTLLPVAGLGTLGWLLVRFCAAVLFFFAAGIGFAQGDMHPLGRRYYKLFLVLLGYITLLTLPNLAGTWGYLGYRAALAGDAITYGLFAFGLALLSLNAKELVAIFKLMAGLSLVVFIVLLPFLDPSAIGAAGTRKEALDVAGLTDSRHVYHFQMGMAVIFPYLFLSSFAFPLRLVWRVALYVTPAFVLLVALYYSKRAVLLDLAVSMSLFLGVIALFSVQFAGVKKLKVFVIGFFMVVLLVIASFAFGRHLDVVVNRLTERFDRLVYTLGETDRIIEMQNYWELLPMREKITGAGSMYFHLADMRAPKGTLHIGWANLYHKGGLPLVAFVAYLLAKNFLMSWRNRHRPSFVIGATLPVLCGISLMHSTIFGSLHGTFAFTLALFLYPAVFCVEDRIGLVPRAGQPGPPRVGGRPRF